MKLRVVQARFGDSLILTNQQEGHNAYILIDGGPNLVYGPYLHPELKKIAAAGEKLDLVVLTHIDNDHVLGLLEFIDDLTKTHYIQVDQMWHNGFSKILPPALQKTADQVESEVAVKPLPDPNAPSQPPPFGVEEGHKLQLADAALGIPRNSGFPNQLVTLEDAPSPVQVAGLALTLVGPPQANLDVLRTKWVQWLMKENLPFAPGQPPPVQPDDSVNNLSSIMFLAEDGQRSILLTGDGLASDIIAGLQKAGRLAPGPDSSLHVDIFKLPHHASVRNASPELFRRVQADTYVLCANGRYGNPDYETLQWLVEEVGKQNRPYTLFATSQTPSLTQLCQDYPPEKNGYTLTVMPPNVTSADL